MFCYRKRQIEELGMWLLILIWIHLCKKSFYVLKSIALYVGEKYVFNYSLNYLLSVKGNLIRECKKKNFQFQAQNNDEFIDSLSFLKYIIRKF